MSDTDIEINDLRQPKDFKGISFSNFKKTDVKKELLNSLINSKIEPACYWSAELVCSGHYADLWDTIIYFYGKYIHLGNPKLSIYLELRIDNFKNILNNGYIDIELRMRNNTKIRKIFCEIICILCNSNKKITMNNIKIKKDDFDITQMTERFKAPNVSFATDIFLEDDPKELFIAINELSYSLTDKCKNVFDACYWIEWLIEFETICKQKKERCICQRRTFAHVDSKDQMDIVWIIWDIFLHNIKDKSKILNKIMNSLLKLFCLKYTKSCNKRRKHILYLCVSLICENINFDIEIIKDDKNKIIMSNIIDKIDLIYKQIKQNEISPGTDYLFKNLNSSNLEKTIAQLEQMNTFGENFIPRLT